MSNSESPSQLCIIVCGAGPAPQVGKLISLAQTEGWRVQVIATPAGLAFIDAGKVMEQTGTPVRSDWGQSATGDPRPSAADALVIAPATFNTVNKLAYGINDNYALNIAAEAIGRGAATAILPFVNSALATRRPFKHAVDLLRHEGIRVLIGEGQWMPHAPGTGGEQIARFPWSRALTMLRHHDDG